MKKLKVLLSFVRLSIIVKIGFYRNVILKMTNNPNFPNPDISLADATTAVDALNTAFLNAQDGSHVAVALMHEAEDQADACFRILAAYVDRIADGNEAIILGSGFESSSQPVYAPKAILAVLNGAKSGSVRLIAKAIDKAGAYNWQMAKDAIPTSEEGWTDIGQTTVANMDKDGLTPGSVYYFRVSAVTPSGVTDFTVAVMKIVI